MQRSIYSVVTGKRKSRKFGNSEILGFPISPCAMSLEGEFPGNRKEFPVCDDPTYV